MPSRPSQPRPLSLLLCGALIFGGSACRGAREAPAPLAVVAAYPDATTARGATGTEDQPIPLYLNSSVAVTFSADVDPFTVTSDTVRVVKLGADGQTHKVVMARRKLRQRSVTLEPIWPTDAELQNGSFQPGQRYRLEVAGFPLTNTVESRTGQGVGQRFYRYYQAVSLEHKEPGPLLPVGLPDDPFRIAVGDLRLASDQRILRLHFSQPLHPASVTAESFDVYAPTFSPEKLPLVASRILREPRPLLRVAGPGQVSRVDWSHPCSTVELTLADHVRLRQGVPIFVDVRPKGRRSNWVRDLRGRAVELQDGRALATGVVTAGTKVELLAIPARGQALPQFRVAAPGRAGFGERDGQLRPLVSSEAGSGALGAFRPSRDQVLGPGLKYEHQGGQRRQAGSIFEFSELVVPAGVTLTLRSGVPMEIRVQGDVRIDGRLVLETPASRSPEEFEEPGGELFRKALATEAFGLRILAAGRIEIRGRVERRLQLGPGQSPLSLVAHGIEATGSLPPRTLLAAERWSGVTQSALQLLHRLPAGLPDGVVMEADAWSSWQRVPLDALGNLELRIETDHGRGLAAVDVFLQVAPADPSQPATPYLDPAGLSEPRLLSLSNRVDLQPGSFFRLQLRARLQGGQALPSLRRIVLLGD